MRTQFNYNKTYYKVTNERENHNGYQYRDELNILEEKSNDNPNISCTSGGFYFTDYNNLQKFFDYDVWIREVKIPEDARVVEVLEGDKGNFKTKNMPVTAAIIIGNDNEKWGTDKFMFGNKYHINK